MPEQSIPSGQLRRRSVPQLTIPGAAIHLLARRLLDSAGCDSETVPEEDLEEACIVDCRSGVLPWRTHG